jgi:hypothetical protein
MVKCCLSFVLNWSVSASADVPPRPCPKAFRFELKTRAHTPISAAASGRNTRPLAREHPQTSSAIENAQIHANHLEAFNASLRRRCAAYRRKTNTYAKKKKRLKPSLDVYWILHNFLNVDSTTTPSILPWYGASSRSRYPRSFDNRFS